MFAVCHATVAHVLIMAYRTGGPQIWIVGFNLFSSTKVVFGVQCLAFFEPITHAASLAIFLIYCYKMNVESL
jgi:hypothetical protein